MSSGSLLPAKRAEQPRSAQIAPLAEDAELNVISATPDDNADPEPATPLHLADGDGRTADPEAKQQGDSSFLFTKVSAGMASEGTEGQSGNDIIYIELVDEATGDLETYPVKKNDVRLPVKALIGDIILRRDKKNFQRYLLYIIIYFCFCVYGFDVNSSYNTYRVYEMAHSEVGAPRLTSLHKDVDVNDWKSQTLPQIADKMQELCHSCDIMVDFEQKTDGYRKTTFKPLDASKTSFSALNRAQSDNILIGNMKVQRSDYRLVISFMCNAQVPGYTPEVKCYEIYNSMATSGISKMWMNVYLAAFFYRIFSVLADAASYVYRFNRNLGYPLCDLILPWRPPTTVTIMNSLEVITITLPLVGQLAWYSGTDPSLFQRLMAINLFFQCAQFYKYAQWWTPFRLVAGTMIHAGPTLLHFLVAMLITFLFFALTAHLLFGNFDPMFKMLTMSIFSVFDKLMNSFPYDTSVPHYQHQPGYSHIYYICVSLMFLLIMSQFLIAVLCSSFDTVREELLSQEGHDKCPEGFILLKEDWSETWSEFMLAFIWPEVKTMGVVNKILSHFLKAHVDDHSDTLMSLERLVRVLGGDDQLLSLTDRKGDDIVTPLCPDPRRTALALIKRFGCVPIALAKEPRLYYDTEPQPFSHEQISLFQSAFSRFDSRRVGTINSFELVALLSYLGMDGITPQDAEDMISEVDIDGDKKLTFHEFLLVIQAAARKEHFKACRPMKEFSFKTFAFRHLRNLSTQGQSSSSRIADGGSSHLGGGAVVSPPASRMSMLSPRSPISNSVVSAGSSSALEASILQAHLDIKSVQSDVNRLHSRAEGDIKRIEDKMALMYQTLDKRIATSTNDIEGKIEALTVGLDDVRTALQNNAELMAAVLENQVKMTSAPGPD